MPVVVNPSQIKHFKTQQEFRGWLLENHNQSDGIWLKLFRKNSGIKSINYAQALDEALCFGWIDGQVKKLDDINSWVQRFTPRRKRSVWSKRNVDNAKRLIKLGLMTPSGQKQIDEAKKDGRWKMAYGSLVNFELPKDFLIEIAKNEKAQSFFHTLNRSKKYVIYWKLHHLKTPAKREEWKKKFIQMISEQKL